MVGLGVWVGSGWLEAVGVHAGTAEAGGGCVLVGCTGADSTLRTAWAGWQPTRMTSSNPAKKSQMGLGNIAKVGLIEMPVPAGAPDSNANPHYNGCEICF